MRKTSWSVTTLTIFAALVFLMLGAAPARAEYCDTIDWGGPRFPDGNCTRIHSATITWAGGRRTILSLLIEDEIRDGLTPASRIEYRRMVDEIASGVGTAMRRLPGVRLPDSINVVIVNDRGPDGGRAETVARTDGVSDCPIMIYESARVATGALARSIAHETFHCAQYLTWPAKMAASGSRWWSEGSAEWFEDFALPLRVGDSDLHENLRLFRTRSATHSLLENTYSNVVLFSWLGAGRLSSFINGMAQGSMSQLDGARRAMSENEYQDFAQAYIDEEIETPSGIRLEGTEFGPQMPTLHTTTGRPGADPIYESSYIEPLTLARGKIIFAPAHYTPRGHFGMRREVFSENPGTWNDMPSPIELSCGVRKEIRFAGMAFARSKLRVDPGTTVGAVTDCSCPLGRWTITEDDLKTLSPSPDYRLVGRGDVWLIFNRDGTASFLARDLRFQAPFKAQGLLSFSVRIDRTYRTAWTWTARGNILTMHETEPLRITERRTHMVRAPYGSSSKTFPARIGGNPTDRFAGSPKTFKCEGRVLTIFRPYIGPRPNPPEKLNYPHYGRFVR